MKSRFDVSRNSWPQMWIDSVIRKCNCPKSLRMEDNQDESPFKPTQRAVTDFNHVHRLQRPARRGRRHFCSSFIHAAHADVWFQHLSFPFGEKFQVDRILTGKNVCESTITAIGHSLSPERLRKVRHDSHRNLTKSEQLFALQLLFQLLMRSSRDEQFTCQLKSSKVLQTPI